MKCEQEFAKLLFRNAIIFIDAAIGYINRGFDKYDNMENVFVGNKVFVSKVMKLYEVDTWRKLSEMADVVKEKRMKYVII